MYAERKIEARSCNYCSNGKSICITHSQCVFVGSGNQHAMRMRHIVIRGLCGSTVFFHINSLTATFSEKEGIEHKMCLIFCTTFV